MTAIFFARDAGAANQVVAIVDLLAGRIECPALLDLMGRLAGEMPRDVAIFGAGPALDVFAAAGASAREFNPADAAAAARFLDERRAQILVTGTGDVDERATPALWPHPPASLASAYPAGSASTSVIATTAAPTNSVFSSHLP